MFGESAPSDPPQSEPSIVARTGAATGTHLVVALASTGRIHEQTLGSLQTMIRSTRRAASVEMWWQSAYPSGHCRNLLVQRFLADQSKTHLVFVDTDMVVPERGLDLLLETGEPLVCGPAPICRPNRRATMSCRSPVDLTTNIMDATDSALRGQSIAPDDPTVEYRPRRLPDLPPGPFSCDVSGMSFCLIAREVLQRVEPPWFHFVDSPDRATVGVDVYFFRKARQLGYRLTVHPEAWCDHIKQVDLTRVEQLLGAAIPEPRWDPKRPDETPPTMVIVCTSRRWLDCRTAETILHWQEAHGGRVGVRLYEADSVGWALARYLNDDGEDPNSWERIMLLGSEVIPTDDLVHQLGSIDAPIVSPLTRTWIDGQIAYTFSRYDLGSGKIDYPMRLALADITEPIRAHHVDLSCSVVRREACHHVTEALSHAVGQRDQARAFNERFCDLVRDDTGLDPVVAPVCVERRVDMGLLGLLKVKDAIRADRSMSTAPPVSAGV